jgi:hypothetical protein
MNANTDLVQRLTEAATEAIANERPTLEHKPEQLQGVTIELKIANSGAVVDATCYVERKYVFRPRKEPAA